MRIAIIGANGYIGRNLVYTLEKDYVDSDLVLYGIEGKNIDGKNNYTQIDMTDKETIKRIDLSCDIVFMLVGKTGSVKSFEDYDTFLDSNERALLNLLNEYRRQNSKARIVFPSTRLVYKGKKGLQSENAEKELKTVYAVNKYSCEKYLEQYNRVYNVQYSIFRICIPYGTMVPGASSYGTIDFMLSKAQKGENIVLFGDGSARRTITYIGDLCKILVEGALSQKCLNDIYNIGGEDFSLREMAEVIANKYQIGIDYVPWPAVEKQIESGDTVFDSTKLDKTIGCYSNAKFVEWDRIRL